MMRKLPKQHLLGLALTLVGVGAFLGIQISDVANQQTYASWASNDDLIDDVFRAGTPSNATIINALFGDGNGNTDDTFYTQHWSSNSCNIGSMSVVNVSPGTNTIPTSLSANTVYVLDIGVYNMTTGPINFNGNCIALVGKRTSMIYSTGAAHIVSNGQGLSIANRNNIIVASIIQETSVIGSAIGIDIESSTNSTVWPIDVMSWDEGIYMENSSFVFVGGNASANRLGIGVQNNSTDIYVGETGPDNITSLTGNEIGLDIADSDDVFVYNTVSTTNVYLGGIVENSSNIVVNGSTFNANSAGFDFAGLRLSGSQNITIDGGSYDANYGAGIFAQNVVGITGNGFSASANVSSSGYGIYLDNVNNLALTNIQNTNNNKSNIHATGSTNLTFTNTTNTGSRENGIQAINTNNLTLSGGSFNQNTYHGIFLDVGTSGAIIRGVNNNLNTLAGINIANSANYNTVISSTISQNGQNGIIIQESHHNTVSGSTITGTITSAGITIYGTSSNNNTIAYTTSAQTLAGPGIVMVGGNNNLITNSIAYENNGVGMGIAGMGISQNDSYNNTIAYSTSYNNIGYGGFGLSLDQVNNTLHHLYAYGNDTDGITIYTAGTGVNYIHDVYTYSNLDNGVYIQESENISGYNIHTYSNEMNGVRLTNTADHNHLSFVEAYENGLNGVEVSDSANNLFENIISFGNTNEGIYLVLKASNNTFNDLQLYNNRIGFRQSSASASKATISNALVYNNSAAGVSLGGSSVINNAAIYNSVTGLTLQGSSNVANNVDVYNNQYGVYMTPSAMAANGKLNNVTVYNNTIGITATSSQTNTYNGLHMFDNDTPFVGTNGSDAQLTAAVPSWAIALANNLVDTGFMTCNRAVQSTNNAAQNLLVYPYCDTRGQIGGWIPTLAVQYTFFPYIYKQQQPVRYVTGSTVSTTGTAITGMFIGDFAYTGYTDFGGHINLTNEGTTYASGGFTYRYDNGPFDIEMNANTGTTKGFVVTGVNNIIWDGVAGSIGSFAGLQYPLVSQYMIAGDGLKIFRAGYDIAGQGLISNYYGQIRGIAAPICGDSVVEYDETCDDGNTNDNDGCNSTCQIEHWDCSWFSGRTATGYVPHSIVVSVVSGISMGPYSFADIIWGDSTPNGNINTGNTHTYMTGGAYTGSIQVTTQFSLVSAVNTTCEFPITAIDPTYCGDGITQTPNGSGFVEQCDLGSGLNGDGINGCANTCTYATPSCTLVSTPTTGYAPLNVNIVATLTDAVLVSFSYGDGYTGASLNTNHVYTGIGATYTPLMTVANPINPMMTVQCSDKIDTLTIACGNSIVEPGEQCDLGQANGNGISGCSSQCTTEPICQLMISPDFIIDSYDTVPYFESGFANGSILSDMTLTSTTTSTNPIVNYQWDIYSSGNLFGQNSNPSPYVFDNTLITAGQGTPTIDLNFSQYIFDGNRPFIRVTLTVTDSMGYQAEYTTPLFRSHDQGGVYRVAGNVITGSNFSGYDFNMTGEMLSSATSGVIPSNQLFWPDVGAIQNVVGIDRENIGTNDEFFQYAGLYNYSNTYTSGVHTLNLSTHIGNTTPQQNFLIGNRNYPIACAVSCGNGMIDSGSIEQCDDGNLNNNDGCSDQCLLEAAPTCGDGIVNQQSEQCDDGNVDDYDTCTSQCISQVQCQTILLKKIDPSIVYQRSYPIWTGSTTGMVIQLNTPTAGANYQYQWSLSGLNTVDINSLQFSGSSTATGVQIFVSVDTLGLPSTPFFPDFSFNVGLTIGDGQITGYVDAVISCTKNGACGFSTYNYYFNTGNVQGFSVNGSYNWTTYIQSINTTTTPTPIGFTGINQGPYFLGIYNTGTFMSYTSPGNGLPYTLNSGANTDTIYFSIPGQGFSLSNNLGVSYYNTCMASCGNGIIENVTGSTTSGTIDYAVSSSISMLTGYWAYDNFYQTGQIQVFDAQLSSGTAVSYVWSFSGFSTGGSNTGFIVGSNTGSTVAIFDDAFAIDSDMEGLLTVQITDADGNVVTTQGYIIIDFDTTALITIAAGSVVISGSQVTYSDYLVYASSMQSGGTSISRNIFSGDALFGTSMWAGYDWYGDNVYDYSEQGTGQVVSYTYNPIGTTITTNLSFYATGMMVDTDVLELPGGVYQSYVFPTTAGGVTGAYQERCDDGNLIDGDGCSSTCDLETPSCNWFTVTAQTGYAPHNFTISILPNIYTGSYTFYDIRWMTGQTSSIFGNDTFTYTGVGSYNPNIRIRPFATSQAQVLQTLTCSRPVTVLSSCGNFVVEGNEQCDDGGTGSNDGCDSQCNFEIPQTCGLSGNLVPNPGFESYTQCPTSYGQFSGYVASWYGSLGGDPDYGNANCAYGTTGMFSYVDQYPHLGSSGMVNILTYASNIPNGGVEYVGAELTTPMQVGNYYDVGFCFATHIRSNYITDSLGMLFTTGASPTNIGWQPILQTPQFEHTGYAQGSGWTCVSGTVYADQAYERFLIGSFHTNTGQNMVPNPIYSGNGLNYTVANYLIDDVFVSPICATCGDAVLDIGEQCDLGTGNGSGNGCNSMCGLDPFQCSQVTSYTTGYARLSFSPQAPGNLINRRYSYVVNRGDGFTSNSRGGAPHTYTGVGNYTGYISLNYSGLTNTGNVANFNVTCPFNIQTIGTTCGNGNIDTYMTGATNGTITSMTYGDINALSFQSHYAPYTNPNATGGLQTGYLVYDTNSGAILPSVLAATWPNPISVTNDIVLEAVLTGSQIAASYSWTVNLYQPGFIYSVVTGYVVGSTTGQSIIVHTNTLYLGSNNTQLAGTISVVITTTSGNQITTTAAFTARGDGTRGIYYPTVDVSIGGSQVTYNNNMFNFAGYGILGGSTFYNNTTTPLAGVQINPYTNGTNCNAVPNGSGCIATSIALPTVIDYTATGSVINTTLFGHGINNWGRNNGIYTTGSLRTILFETTAGSSGAPVVEQCDDGNQNNGDGCNNSCQRAQATCALYTYPASGVYPLPVIFSLSMPQGVALSVMNYGDGTTGTVTTGHTYAGTGLFAPTAFVYNVANTGITAYCQSAVTSIACSNNNQCPSGLMCLPDGTCGGCQNGATNPPLCNQCGTGQFYCSTTSQCLANGQSCGEYCGDGIKNGNEECDGGSGCRTNCTRSGGGGGSGPNKDSCDGKDESPSYYDGTCKGEPKHTAAPVGRACKYSDEQYLARGPFMDTLTHRALPYTEMMRASCMWRGRDTDEGKWNANPNENITVAEVLKTFVKLQGVAFDDFDIKTENARYPKATPFADVPQDHWFAWYADYAVKKGLTQGLVTNKDGKNYLDPDRHITRNDAVKFMMITYDSINKKKVGIDGKSVLGDVVNASDPYYQYIRKAEALGFISGVKQTDGSYRFDGKRPITRAEFAKIASVPFNDQLFDTSSLVLNSPVYKAIVKALDKVAGDKIEFIQTLLINMNNISDTQFIKKFKVTKAIFIQELRNAILPGLYEDASSDD